MKRPQEWKPCGQIVFDISTVTAPGTTSLIASPHCLLERKSTQAKHQPQQQQPQQLPATTNHYNYNNYHYTSAQNMAFVPGELHPTGPLLVVNNRASKRTEIKRSDI